MDNLTKAQRKKTMSRIRSKGTSPEKLVMRALRKRNIYFAKHVASIFGTPDIVFRRKKIAVFIDSDFWHRHPTRFIMPKTNVPYWRKKIRNNRLRDREVNARLKKEGWKVLRIWEYEIKHNLNKSVNRILSLIEVEPLPG